MNTTMTATEFFGITLAAAACMMSVFCMMIGYTAAKHRLFQTMLRYLRLAGMLSLSSWFAMAAVLLRCESKCWVVRNKPLEATPVSQDHVYTVTTPAGVNLQWRSGYVGLSRVAGHSGGSGGKGGLVSGGG